MLFTSHERSLNFALQAASTILISKPSADLTKQKSSINNSNQVDQAINTMSKIESACETNGLSHERIFHINDFHSNDGNRRHCPKATHDRSKGIGSLGLYFEFVAWIAHPICSDRVTGISRECGRFWSITRR